MTMNVRLSRCFSVVIAVALCATAWAARPPDWLSLPTASEPRPADASTWILVDAESFTQTSATTSTRRCRRAFMPLSQAGVEALRCGEEFTPGGEELVSARAWAMSPDGKQCRAFGGDEFFIVSLTLSNMAWDQRKVVYFNPRRFLQKGWIFAYEVEVSSKYTTFDERWTPDRPWPTRQVSFELTPMRGGEIRWRAFSPELEHPSIGANGSVKWSFTDVPAIKSQVPDRFQMKSRDVRAYFITPEQVASKQTQTWADVVRLASKEMDPAIVTTPELEAEAKRLVGQGTLWQRVAPICRFVQKDVTYMQVTIDTDTMAGYRPHRAPEVFSSRYGDCKDKAVLLSTMLRTVGIQAGVVLVNAEAPRRNSVDWPSAWFNHAIVAIRADEPPPEGWPVVECLGKKWVLFDPTAEITPLGLLPFGDTLGLALILQPGVEQPITIPANAADQNRTTLVLDAQLGADGSVAVDATEERFGMAGALAVAYEQASSQLERTGAFEKRIQARTPLVTKFNWSSECNESDNRWKAKTQFSAQFVGKRLVKGQMFVAPDLLLSLPQTKEWEEGVDGWVSWAPSSLSREVRLKLPDGWDLGELPPKVELTNAAGVFKLEYRKDGAVVVGTSKIDLAGGVLDRAGYLELRSLLHRVAAASRTPVILQRAPQAASGPAAASGS